MATSNFSLLLLAFSLLAITAGTTARPCKSLFFTITTTTISQNPNPNFTKFSISTPRFPTFFFTTTTTFLNNNNNPPKFPLSWRRPNPILTRPHPEEELESRSSSVIRKFEHSVFFRRSDPEEESRWSSSSMIRKFGPNRPSIFFFRRSGPILVRPDPAEFNPTRREVIPVGFYSSSIRDRTKDIMRVVGALLFGVGCGALTAATMYLIWSLFWPNYRFDFEDSDDDFEDVSAEKMGYVAIPSNKVVDDDDLKKPAAPTKEVV